MDLYELTAINLLTAECLRKNNTLRPDNAYFPGPQEVNNQILLNQQLIMFMLLKLFKPDVDIEFLKDKIERMIKFNEEKNKWELSH